MNQDLPDRIASLTERERQCLRLVARDRGSGEIARALDLSINTVEAHIKSARAKLGGVSRFAAAALLAEFEQRHHSLASLSSAIEKTLPDGDLETSPTAGCRLGEQRVPFSIPAPSPPASAKRGKRRNDLSPLHRLALIALLLLIGTLAVIASIPMSDSAQSIANRIDPPTNEIAQH